MRGGGGAHRDSSVMNGFESELRERLLSLNAAVRISAPAE
jgi:ABC-type lipoprotein release transport system permease subunit